MSQYGRIQNRRILTRIFTSITIFLLLRFEPLDAIMLEKHNNRVLDFRWIHLSEAADISYA
jgi:hypothetical protein